MTILERYCRGNIKNSQGANRYKTNKIVVYKLH